MGPPLVLGPKPLRLDLASAVLIGVALGLLATALRLALSARGIILVVGLATAALASGPAAFVVLRRSRRSILTPFERGVVFESRGRKWTFLLQDLQTFALRERDLPGGLLRRITLIGSQGSVRFEHFARRGEEDRLGAVLVHLLARLVEVTERKLQTGGTLSGWDWILGSDGLAAPAQEHPIPLAEIGAVTVRQHRVAIWKPRDRFPFFVVPADSPNSLLLVALLSRRLEER
jgi:hypothetical protein